MQKNIEKSRFAACAADARLLKIYARAAVHPAVNGAGFIFSAADPFFRQNPGRCRWNLFLNLTRREIFRGKILRRKKLKLKPNTSPQERTPSRHIHE